MIDSFENNDMHIFHKLTLMIIQINEIMQLFFTSHT